MDASPVTTRPRRLPLRPIEPPYDDERGRLSLAAGTPVRQPTLPLTFPPRGTRPTVLSAPVPHRPSGVRELADSDLTPAWRSTPRTELCDPLPWARQLARGIAEVLIGARPARQLSAWLTEDSQTALRRGAWRRRVRSRVGNGPLDGARVGVRRQSSRVLVRSVHVSEPSDGVAEISAHLWIDDRGTAIALRAEGRDGRWICTAINVGW
jgi:hypothetical protein